MNKGLCKNLQNTERKNTGKLGVWFFTFHKSYKRCVTTQKQPKVSNASLNHWCSLHTDHCCHCHLQEKTSEFSSPDMVPTPMTRHSTRASRVKVGPRMAMPWEMFSLTSSYTRHRDEAGIRHLNYNPSCEATGFISVTFSTYSKNNVLLYLGVWAEGKFGQCTGFGQVDEKEKERQRFTAEKQTDHKLGKDRVVFHCSICPHR